MRSYDPAKPVSREEVDALIAAAMEAPSWKNSETARYHVVMSAEIHDKLRECMMPQNRIKTENAPVLIVTTFVKDTAGFDQNGNPDNELGNGWGIYDLGLNNALFLLKAADLGLDTLVMGLRDADAIRELLKVPENEKIVSVIALGHRNVEPVRPDRKPLGEVAKFY